MQAGAVLLLVLAGALSTGPGRSPLNDFQRLKATQLLSLSQPSPSTEQEEPADAEECARRCTALLDCRAFHYNHQRHGCQLLPWTQHSVHTHMQRNVHYDLYQKKDYLRNCIMGDGRNYRGLQAVTEKGKKCQQWKLKLPHDHR